MKVRCSGRTYDGKHCYVEADAILVVAHRVLRRPLASSFYPADLFKTRVLGWFHQGTRVFCSRACYANYLDAEHYDHYPFCRECNYDRDCFTCDCDDGTAAAEAHACNCSEGPGTKKHGAGWGYYRRKLVQRLKKKNSTVCVTGVAID